MRRTLILLLPLVLAACQKADNAPGPGGVTVGEARALDEAAQMIEDQRITPAALPSPKAAAPASPQPSGAPKPPG